MEAAANPQPLLSFKALIFFSLFLPVPPLLSFYAVYSGRADRACPHTQSLRTNLRRLRVGLKLMNHMIVLPVGFVALLWDVGTISPSTRALASGLVAVGVVNLVVVIFLYCAFKEDAMVASKQTPEEAKKNEKSGMVCHSRGTHFDALLGEEMLDKAEQEEVVKALEVMQASQERMWRVCYGIIAYILATLCILDAVLQFLQPWQTMRHAWWRGTVEGPSLCLCEVIQGIALAGFGVTLTRGLPSSQKAATDDHHGIHRTGGVSGHADSRSLGGAAGVLLVCSLCVAVYLWMKLSYQDEPYSPAMLWLPLGPLVYCLLCSYVMQTFRGTSSEVDRLRGAMYHFKKL